MDVDSAQDMSATLGKNGIIDASSGPLTFLSTWNVFIPILLLCILFAPLSPWKFFQESIGMVVLIVTQCGVGPIASLYELHLSAWFVATVIFSDWSCGGPTVNPTQALVKTLLGEETFFGFLTRCAAQMTGGLLAWPLLAALLAPLDLQAKGPAWHADALERGIANSAPLHEALLQEFTGNVVVVFGIQFLNRCGFCRPYWPRITLIGVWVRVTLVTFPASGPALNPVLATTYGLFETTRYSSDGLPHWGLLTMHHFSIYWAVTIAGALVAVGLLQLALRLLGSALPGKAAPDDKKQD